MNKQGWVVAGLLSTALIVGAAASGTQDQKVLEEIRDLIKEMRRVQAFDVHRRHYPLHEVEANCTFSTECGVKESQAAVVKSGDAVEEARAANEVKRRLVLWLTVDGPRTPEEHGKIFTLHTMDKVECDFGRSCEYTESLQRLLRSGKEKKPEQKK